MFKKILLGGLILTGVFSVAYAVWAADGFNYVNVNSCEQVGSDIRINRSGKTYVLTSSCRDAGHGFRNYKMTCTSKTQYRVDWTENCTPPKPQDTSAPVVSLSSNKKSYNDGETVYLTATASDNVKVKKIVVYNESGKVLRTCDYTNSCSATDVIKFNGPSNINWGITSFSARAYDEVGNVGYKGIDVEVNRYPQYNYSIQTFSNTFNDNGVTWLKIGADVRADRGVSSVEIYLGNDSSKYNNPLVKKCSFNGGDKNVSCSLSFPRSLYHSGYFWVRMTDRDGNTKDSDLNYYNY